MIEPYIPDTLPLKIIDWERHVTLIGKANAAERRASGSLAGTSGKTALTFAKAIGRALRRTGQPSGPDS